MSYNEQNQTEENENVDLDIDILEDLLNRFFEKIKNHKHTFCESPIPLLMRNIFEITHSILILSCEDLKLDFPSNILMRTLFENYLNLKYILHEHGNIQERLANYSYFNLIDNRKLLTKLENKGNNGLIQKLEKDIILPFEDICIDSDIINDYKKLIEEMFEDEPLRTIHNRYLNLECKERKNMKWYKMDSELQSIFDLACYLQMGAYYQLFYSEYSLSVHGLDASLEVQEIGEDNLNLCYPRIADSFEDMKTYICIMLYESLNLAEEYYDGRNS